MCAANEAEQYIHNNNLHIRGFMVQPSDDCRSVVTSLIRDKLGNQDANLSDIEAATTSNLRRACCKGPIDSDDSQVQDRPLPGKPMLRYSPST